jgi:hypothetical protein
VEAEGNGFKVQATDQFEKPLWRALGGLEKNSGFRVKWADSVRPLLEPALISQGFTYGLKSVPSKPELSN